MNHSFYNNMNSLLSIARNLYKQGDFKSSKLKFESCLEIAPNEALLLFEYGCCLFHLKNYNDCLNSLHKLIEIEPKHARGQALLGTIYSDLGNKKLASKHHYQAIQMEPTLTQSAYGFAKATNCTLESEQYHFIKSLLDNQQIKINDQIRIHFSLAEIHYANKDYSGQIKYLKQGNQLARSCFPFNAEAQQHHTARIIESFSNIKKYPTGEQTSIPESVFILGLPRSGSTLLEQMLAGHSDIQGAGETENLSKSIGSILQQNNNLRLPEDVNLVTADIWKKASINFDQQLVKTSANFVIDKQLFNFNLAGFAKMMKPGSLFIDLRRDPASQFISCYSILFGENRGFTHSVESFADAYSNQRKLIDFWKRQFPENFISLYYENLITHPELTINKILAKLGVEFQQGCLDFFLSKQAVTSASQHQVKQPLYTDSLDRWKNYKELLKDEAIILEPLVSQYRLEKEQHDKA